MRNLNRVNNYFYPGTILDIGANIGEFHLECKQIWPFSYIFSIEASEMCEPHLREITKDFYIGLLSKDNNEYNFYQNKDVPTNTGNSVYKELTHMYTEDAAVVVKKKGVMLDDLSFAREFDLIKIDTQGSELDIIMGGKKVCSQAKGIILEVSVKEYNQGAPLITDVFRFMDEFGFKPAELLDEYIADSVNLHQQDYLFIRK